jgi:hypothetical protein
MQPPETFRLKPTTILRPAMLVFAGPSASVISCRVVCGHRIHKNETIYAASICSHRHSMEPEASREICSTLLSYHCYY